MSCHHKPGDPECSSSAAYVRRQMATTTPDASNYEVEDVAQMGKHLVLKVKYPNCRSCAFEGSKVMVFLNTTSLQAMRWRRIDPHFRDPKLKLLPTDAPSPAARFPGDLNGWIDATTYARGKA